MSARGRTRGDWRTGDRQTLRLTLDPARDISPERLGADDALATLTVSALRPDADGHAATAYLRWESSGSGGGRYVVVSLEH